MRGVPFKPFLGALKGLLFCLKLQKIDHSVKGRKNEESFFTGLVLLKTQKRVVTLSDSPFGNMSKTATVAVTKRDVLLLMEKRKNIFSN